MNIEEFREYCLSLPYVEERFPFDEETLCFYIGSKMFALCDLNRVERVNLKCVPEKSIELRENYNGIIAGWHMNKRHWNTVYLDSDVPQSLVRELINDSYHLVYKNLPKRERDTMPL